MSIDLHTLSGAYAVNALSAEEAESFTRHLEQCAACRDEVRELRAAAARMGASEAVAPPSALKARVLAAADREPQLPPKVTPIERARSRRWTSRLVGAAAAVILVVTGGYVVTRLASDEEQPPVATGPVAQVFDAPDAHTATVPTANGGKVKVATSAEAGRMAVETSGLPKLERRSYQMWAIHNGKPTSVGIIEDLDAGKVMPMPASGTTVAITVEPEGGSKQPTQQPILQVNPETV